MRVLVLDTGDPAEVSGGQSVFVRNLLTHSKHEIVVACTVPEGVRLGQLTKRRVGDIEPHFLPIAHHHGAGRRPVVPERLRCLLGAIAFLGKARDADVIYVHSAELMLAALLHRRRRQIVFHVHGAANPLSVSRYPWARRGLPLKFYGWLWRRLVARMDRVLSVDAAGCQAAQDAAGGGACCDIIPPAFDETVFDWRGEEQRARRRIIHVGRVEWGKRLDLLIGALRILRGRNVDWEAVIVGEGSERAALEAMSVELGVAAQCRFLGWMSREELPAELRRSSLFVLPSMTEGVTTAVLEALACGTPVLTRPLAGLATVVQEGKNGAFWTGDDQTSLADAIESAESVRWSPEIVAGSVASFSCQDIIGRVDAVLEAALSTAR